MQQSFVVLFIDEISLFSSPRYARIPVKTINGYAKGYSHKVTEDFDLSKIKSNHAWNAIFIEGEWRLVDSTWDAGFSDGKSFHWQKQDFFFLMDPEYFVNSHLPYTDKDQSVSKSWQLLDNPVDPKTFFKSLKLEEDSIKFGVFPRSHQDAIVHVNGEICIEIERYTPGDIMETLTSFVSKDENKEYKECVASERSGDRIVKFHVRPPNPGTYKMTVLLSPPNEREIFKELFTYIVKCDSVLKNLVLFPKQRRLYGPLSMYKELGFGKGVEKHSFFSTTTGELEIVLPTIRQMDVMCRLEDGNSNEIQNAVFQQSTANSITLSVRLPQKGNYRLNILAPSGKEKEYIEAANFLIQCTSIAHELKPFPDVYSGKVMDYGIDLHEPKTKEIPANSAVVFRFSSPKLKSVCIKNKTFQKTNDSNEWEIVFDTPGPWVQINVYGSDKEKGSMDGLFEYITR